MFVYSVKASQIKLAALVLAVVLAAGTLLYISHKEKPVNDDGGINLQASTAAERKAFLSQFGWEFDEEPTEVTEVLIPEDFDDTYQNYNSVQQEQNMDLWALRGKRVKRWTYTVKNYPGYEKKPGTVQANILVYDGVVVGGDVCSLEPKGFLQGFSFPADAGH
ncbi:MAG: DUF4830 domain-containing protein [Oscillospiraceae bacterium]|jgi:hypothetical protein|nr:DUF4830 domain-containing protein [Oscillospiraceae bacterium]